LSKALIIGREFIASAPSCLILGDNIFYGQGMVGQLRTAGGREHGATVFGYRVSDPQRYGVAEFDSAGSVVGLEEKPTYPKSGYAVTGIYFYDGQVCDLAAELQPSARGELEITDLNRRYLALGELFLEKLERDTAWLNTGTHESLMQAGSFIETIELRQGLKICCPEEIAYRQSWIDANRLALTAESLSKSGYGDYLLGLLGRDG